VDGELRRILEFAVAVGPVQSALAALRAAGSHAKRREHLNTLIAALDGAGIDTRHAVIAAANARILRPGTSAGTDEALLRLSRDWAAAEDRLGIELETRIFAYSCRDRDDLETAMPELHGTDTGWRYGQILGVLWPHGWRVRANALAVYNEFSPHAPTDQRSLRRLVPPAVTTVDLVDGWWDRMAEALVRDGLCELTCPSAAPGALAHALTMIGARAVDTGSYLLHPFIERIDRRGDTLRANIALEAPIL
jgi:hypothetical protein